MLTISKSIRSSARAHTYPAPPPDPDLRPGIGQSLAQAQVFGLGRLDTPSRPHSRCPHVTPTVTTNAITSLSHCHCSDYATNVTAPSPYQQGRDLASPPHAT